MEKRRQGTADIVAGNDKREDIIGYSRDSNETCLSGMEDLHIDDADGHLDETGFHLEKDLIKPEELRGFQLVYNCFNGLDCR